MGEWPWAGTGEHDAFRLVLDLLALEQGRVPGWLALARSAAGPSSLLKYSL